jgi:hypothetical protein
MRRGTTSVVPQMADLVSGFSRWVITNNLKQEDTGAKAQYFVTTFSARLNVVP